MKIKKCRFRFLRALAIFMIPFTGSAQKTSCCLPAATIAFTHLAMNSSFAAAHPSPLPFHFTPNQGKMIKIQTDNGSATNVFFVSSPRSTRNWLLVFHEWWGLNDYIKKECERLRDEIGDINVVGLDLYDGKIASTPEEAQHLMKGMNDERVRNIIRAVIGFTGENASIQTLGWCMGGGWALQAALLSGEKEAGCVMYYGMPERDISKLRHLNSDVLGIFAIKDQWITREVVNEFKKNMDAAGKTLTENWYDADHAFANPSNPDYDHVSASDADNKVITYLKNHLKK